MRTSLLIMGSVIAAAVLVALLVEATGKGVAIAIAAVAIFVCLGQSVWFVRLLLRAARDEDAVDLRRVRFPVHAAIVIAGPWLVAAAHPWGMASLAVGGALLIVCHLITTAGSVLLHTRVRRRA